MKNKSINFAAYFAKVYFIIFVCVVFFITANLALYAANTGYQIPAVYYTSKVSKCTLASSGGDSLSYINTLIFHSQMPKYNENQSSVNNSTATLTPDCESVNPTVLPPHQKLTVSENTYVYLNCLQQLDTLYVCIHEALELNYGWQQTDRIMNNEYHEKSCAIRDMINSYMCASIGENINSRSEITEI